jgi:hypothetical protein
MSSHTRLFLAPLGIAFIALVAHGPRLPRPQPNARRANPTLSCDDVSAADAVTAVDLEGAD